MKEIKNQLPEGIMGNIQCILSATSIEEITKLELRVKEMLKIFVDFYPHKKEEIYLVYLKHASPFHQVIVIKEIRYRVKIMIAMKHIIY